jgi:hypothetical protein
MTESAQAAQRSELRATIDGCGRVDGDASLQCAEAVVLVRPAQFAFNPETAASNSFQQQPHLEDTAARARAEHELLSGAIRAAGVRVCVIDDTPRPVKPDAIFPNNWISWHRDGTVILYPMTAPNRRLERRPELLARVAAEVGFRSRRLLDFSAHEREGRYLEGTGSLVLDHAHRVAYACRSVRTDESLLRAWARAMRYEPVVFDARTTHGSAPYHTNVLLSIGTHWVVVCAESIADADRDRVLGRLRATGRDLIAIGHSALHAFAANIIELSACGAGGGRRSVLALSRRASAALRAEPDAWPRLTSQVDQVLELEVPTIEHVGGGSVRCMLAEVPVAESRGDAR